MPGGFGPRFAIEAGFLILLGVGAGYADLRPSVIVALLAGGWALVTLIELSVWRAEARSAVLRMPPAPAEAEEPELQPEVEVGWPLEEDAAAEDEAYPLRNDAEVRDAEAQDYTRVLGGPERASSDDAPE
jgi:hypothetical protein